MFESRRKENVYKVERRQTLIFARNAGEKNRYGFLWYLDLVTQSKFAAFPKILLSLHSRLLPHEPLNLTACLDGLYLIRVRDKKRIGSI